MITLERAKQLFEEMIKSNDGYALDQVSEVALEEPVYVVIAVDKNGNQVLPGQIFPAIRKKDGKAVNFDYTCPA